MHHNEPTHGIIALYDQVKHDMETTPLEWVQATRWMVATEENKKFLSKDVIRLDNNGVRPFLLREMQFGKVALFRHRLSDDCEDILAGYDSAFQNMLKNSKQLGFDIIKISSAALRNIKHGG